MKDSLGASLVLKKLTKQYGNKTILSSLDLTIDAGDFISIVGKSGCGKSTLLKIIAGLESVTSGSLLINQENVQTFHQNIRLMFQESRLLPWKTVLNNVLIGLNKTEKKLQALEVLEEVGLLDKANEWPYTLSGGQKQRVALARALIHRPKVLLLDEPLGALDAFTRMNMQHLIEKLWQQYRFTVILVTHDINEAVVTSNRVLLLEDGKKELDLTIPLNRPRVKLTDVAYYEQIIYNKIVKVVVDETEYTI